jgi:nitrite reductase/ring-hydroxylating ferredoxin subunit/DMSO/TMAO reductase YedYZ heme-binding membrane subunit
MSASYQTILWNRQKKIYDLTMVGLIAVYLVVFIGVSLLTHPEVTQETLIIRSTATLAILLLHIILIIGPLARINPIFLPLLYNRRHLGVTMFIVGATHGGFSIVQFHALSNTNPILSVFTSNTHYDSYGKFPFEVFGVLALMIFFLMAITSHDFWLHNLGPRFWKTMHMLVYFAYALVIMHVLLGVVRYETSPVLVSLLGAGMIAIIALHLAVSWKEHRRDGDHNNITSDGFVNVGALDSIAEKRAKVVTLGGERIAIFRYDGKVSAISNVCKHQNGPLGEGRIVDGCVTCPWHGYQYLPHNGTSPPPFTEKVATYDVKIINKDVWLNPTPYPDGTARTPALTQNFS